MIAGLNCTEMTELFFFSFKLRWSNLMMLTKIWIRGCISELLCSTEKKLRTHCQQGSYKIWEKLVLIWKTAFFAYFELFYQKIVISRCLRIPCFMLNPWICVFCLFCFFNFWTISFIYIHSVSLCLLPGLHCACCTFGACSYIILHVFDELDDVLDQLLFCLCCCSWYMLHGFGLSYSIWIYLVV